MTASHELDDLIEEALPTAGQIAICIKDRDAEGVRDALGPLLDEGDRDRIAALIIALGALVPDDRSYGELLAWTCQEQIPYGQLIIDGAEKYCRGCNQVRPRRCFYVDRSRKDGLTSRCKFCVAERNERRRLRASEAKEAGAA